MDLRDVDINAIAARYETVFRRTNERPVFNISYGLGKTVTMPPTPAALKDRWFNFEWRIECAERNLENVGFLAEGFPSVWCNLGPDILAAFTGSELVIESDSTNWARFRVKNWKEEPPIRFLENGYYWQQMKKFLELCVQHGKGRWLTGSGDLHTNGDGLAALRGPENLLMDLYDCPEEIHKRLAEMHKVFQQALDGHLKIIHPASNGMNTSWCNAAVKGRFATIQNDFCCMVGPEMFDEFFKAYIENEAACLDHSIYHLDGPGAVRHLESICASPHLDVIQWVPGAGNKPMNQWPELLRRIQQLGKGLWLYGSPAEQLDILTQVEPAGCMYTMWCKDRAEAEAWLKKADAILRLKRPVQVSKPGGKDKPRGKK